MRTAILFVLLAWPKIAITVEQVIDPVTTFARAVDPRPFTFPADFGSHPQFKTEWWYLTGCLQTEQGEIYGYQATWFRQALVPKLPTRTSKLASRDIYLFHGTLTDVKRHLFVHERVTSRGASTWAGSESGKLKVFLLGRSLESQGATWRLKFKVKGRDLDLKLTPECKPLLHGVQPGLSQKGPLPGQASYYASMPRIKTEGRLQLTPTGPSLKVSGNTWYDQEFGSNQLAPAQVGWDWFSVALDDGTDLMLYNIRKDHGAIEPHSSGSIRLAGERKQHLTLKDYSIEVLDHWNSPHSSARYPAKWRLNIPSQNLELVVTPLCEDQELAADNKSSITYWEGLCGFEGQRKGKKISGKGYVELVGYAGSIKGKF